MQGTHKFAYRVRRNVRPPSEACARRVAWDLLARPEGATLEEVGAAVRTRKYPEGLPTHLATECVRLIHHVHGAGLKQDKAGRIQLVLPKDATLVR